jgi:L-asparagine oxygenase
MTSTAFAHPVPTVDTSPADWDELTGQLPLAGPDDPEFVRSAGRGRRHLPPAVHDALADMGDDTLEDIPGVLLVRGVSVGAPPTTPSSPGEATGKDHVSEFVLLTVARALGQPVGYLPEHGGALVQDLVPTAAAATRQTSTSSAVELEFHTETAFHPHRPRYLLLLCLRGDPAAQTLLCDVDHVLDLLDPEVRAVLGQPRFRTGVDESFTDGAIADRRPPSAVLSGNSRRPTLVFDADLMQGTDPEAQAALETFRDLTRARRGSLSLEAGDLLVVDNDRCIHGRSSFRARFDGTDRWLQRSFVVGDLGPSAGERRGRVITTTFT